MQTEVQSCPEPGFPLALSTNQDSTASPLSGHIHIYFLAKKLTLNCLELLLYVFPYALSLMVSSAV